MNDSNIGDPRPTRIAEVVRLIQSGLNTGEVARELKVERTIVTAGLLTAVRGSCRMSMSAALGPAARVRGLTVPQLFERVLKALAAEPNLVDAVLDDVPADGWPTDGGGK